MKSTAKGFLEERRDFLDVAVVPALSGVKGYDVVLRIDGTYFYDTIEEVEGVAQGMREWLRGLTDVRRDGWSSWDRHKIQEPTKP